MKELVSWLRDYGFEYIDNGLWFRFITPNSTYRVTIRSEDVLFTYRMYCGSPNDELMKVERNTCISYSSLRGWYDCGCLDDLIIYLLVGLTHSCHCDVLKHVIS